jgi:hypothetical protein
MQTSFMHPPFGFALFYLRSVAPAAAFLDKVTGRPTAPVTTGQIYWGAAPFVVIQMIMVAIVIAFPGLVTSSLHKGTVDPATIEIDIPAPEYRSEPPEEFRSPGDPAPSKLDYPDAGQGQELEELFKK